jgi:acetate kinase
MGFTPMDGIPMARRSGSVDPGILIHLLRHGGQTVDSLDRMLNHDSGLAGLSGTSGDMREILAGIDQGSEASELALGVFVHQVRKGIAAMAASMGGMDALVFSGGVGEHAAAVRARIGNGLEFLGVNIDEGLNLTAEGEAKISAAGSKTAAMVIPAEENWVIARACFAEMNRI